jgi:hypothetical protein
MAAISRVYTISHVAKMLGEDEELLWEIAGAMFPEHGCLWVVGIGEDGVMAFTEFGIDNLRDSIIATRESMKKN